MLLAEAGVARGPRASGIAEFRSTTLHRVARPTKGVLPTRCFSLRRRDLWHLRLSGLMVVLGLTFGVVFALSRTRLWVVFGGSLLLLGALGAFNSRLSSGAGTWLSGAGTS